MRNAIRQTVWLIVLVGAMVYGAADDLVRWIKGKR